MRSTILLALVGVVGLGTSACVFDGGESSGSSMGGASSLVDESEQELYAAIDPLWVADKRSGTTTLGVCFKNYDSKWSKEFGWVKSSVEGQWEAATNINFTGFGACTGSEKIKIQISDEGPHTEGLGTKYGTMYLNFTFKNWSTKCAASASRENCIRSIAVHEFGHALGLAHEQNRPDVSCSDAPQGSDGVIYWAYDPDSVMNYCNTVWNNNGILSAKDRDGIARLYGNTGFNMTSGSSYWLRWQDGMFGRISSGKNGGTNLGVGLFGASTPQPFMIKKASGTGTLKYKTRVTVGASGWFLAHGVPIRGSTEPYFEVSRTASEWEIVDPRNTSSTSVIGVNEPFVLKVPGKTYYLGKPKKGEFLNGFGLTTSLSDRVDWRGLGPR